MRADIGNGVADLERELRLLDFRKQPVTSPQLYPIRALYNTLITVCLQRRSATVTREGCVSDENNKQVCELMDIKR